MKKLLLLLPIIGLALGMAACSTVKGAGQDLQDSSEWVEEKADGDD
jgi:predicted small secreted protein